MDASTAILAILLLWSASMFLILAWIIPPTQKEARKLRLHRPQIETFVPILSDRRR